jgi:hypothetical protein
MPRKLGEGHIGLYNLFYGYKVPCLGAIPKNGHREVVFELVPKFGQNSSIVALRALALPKYVKITEAGGF